MDLHLPRPQGVTAFVLSGGASLGAMQAGMLEALYERGIVPDLICGSSVGAVNGAFIASRPPTVETARALGDVWRGLRRSEVFPTNPMTGLLGLVGRRDSLVPGSGLERTLRRHLQFDRLQDAPIPLHVTATDVLTGDAVRLSRGDALDAVLASAAIPGVLPSVRWHGRDLVDGGVADNTPLSHAIALGAGTVYVLPTGSACALAQPPRGAVGMILQATAVLNPRRIVEQNEGHPGGARLIVLPPPCPLHVLPLDFGRADELIDAGRSGARAFLDADGTFGPEHPLHPHDHVAA
jgi:NTE family protein